MEIILLKDVDNLGDINDVVQVKNGYARNYLIPQKLAVVANSSNLKVAAARAKAIAAREEARVGEYQAIAEKLNGIVLKIGAKAGSTGKIFGSVTNVQLAAALKEQHEVDINRKKINILEDVKTIGVYSAALSLHPTVVCNISFEVSAE